MNCIYCRLTGLLWNLFPFNWLAQECNPNLGLHKIIYHLASFFKEISNLIITISDIACTMHYTKMIQNQNGTIVEICPNWMIYISSDAKLDGDSIHEEGFFISGSYPLQ